MASFQMMVWNKSTSWLYFMITYCEVVSEAFIISLSFSDFSVCVALFTLTMARQRCSGFLGGSRCTGDRCHSLGPGSVSLGCGFHPLAVPAVSPGKVGSRALAAQWAGTDPKAWVVFSSPGGC